MYVCEEVFYLSFTISFYLIFHIFIVIVLHCWSVKIFQGNPMSCFLGSFNFYTSVEAQTGYFWLILLDVVLFCLQSKFFLTSHYLMSQDRGGTPPSSTKNNTEKVIVGL